MTFPDNEGEWKRRAADYLKALLDRSGVTYKNLAHILEPYGFKETEASLTNKLKRGSFSAAFYLACMAALDTGNITMEKFKTPLPKVKHYRHRKIQNYLKEVCHD